MGLFIVELNVFRVENTFGFGGETDGVLVGVKVPRKSLLGNKKQRNKRETQIM